MIQQSTDYNSVVYISDLICPSKALLKVFILSIKIEG